MLYVPDVQLAKSDKPGGPMVAKRVKVLRQMEEMSKDAELKAKDINDKYEETINKARGLLEAIRCLKSN